MQPQSIRPTMVIDRRIGAFILDLLIIGALTAIAVAAVSDYTFDEHASLAAAEAQCTTHNDQGTDGLCLPTETGALVVRFTRVLSPIVFHLALWLLRGAVEGITGWSPGKLAAGIRVVDAGGSRIGAVKGLVRALLLPVDGFPWGAPMLVAMMVASNNQRQQRLGDLAADSFVVHKAAVGQFVSEPVALATLLPTPPGTPPPVAAVLPPPNIGVPSPAGQAAAIGGGPVLWPSEPPTASPTPPPPTAPVRPPRQTGMSFDEQLQAYLWVESDRTLIWDDTTRVWRDYTAG